MNQKLMSHIDKLKKKKLHSKDLSQVFCLSIMLGSIGMAADKDEHTSQNYEWATAAPSTTNLMERLTRSTSLYSAISDQSFKETSSHYFDSYPISSGPGGGKPPFNPEDLMLKPLTIEDYFKPNKDEKWTFKRWDAFDYIRVIEEREFYRQLIQFRLALYRLEDFITPIQWNLDLPLTHYILFPEPEETAEHVNTTPPPQPSAGNTENVMNGKKISKTNEAINRIYKTAPDIDENESIENLISYIKKIKDSNS